MRERERILKASLPVVALALILFVLPSVVPFAYADQVFHTEQLPFQLTSAGAAAGFPALRTGHVVDIHANGPTVYAIEEYMINGAPQNSQFQVTDLAWVGGCPANPSTPPSFALPTVVLTTDSNGFAEGHFMISPQTITQFGLHGVTLGIVWTLTSITSGVAAYSTPACINVALD